MGHGGRTVRAFLALPARNKHPCRRPSFVETFHAVNFVVVDYLCIMRANVGRFDSFCAFS